ncbi:MAG TPA: amidohydrolase family protein [Gemmatimonadaceae bacterium]
MRLTLLAPLAIGLAASSAPAQSYDVLIRGGTVVTGNAAPRRADVGIQGDRIAFVGTAPANATAKRIIEARGLTVAPGFIDPHTHTSGDLSSAQSRDGVPNRANVPYLMQGVTTVITNNDGGSPIDIGRQLEGWKTNGIGTNAAVYIGQGSVRGAVVGSTSAAATPAQIDSMKKLVARAMDAGAIGMSTGLYYAPGSYSTTEEVIELAKVAAAKGGMYDSHIRDESSYSVGLVGAVNEVIRIGREARMPVHISHIKALGVDVWGQSDTVIALMKKARAQGIDITASQYPYTASGSSVGASLLPRWAESGGGDSLRMRLRDPATRAKIVTEMEDNLRRRGGANTLLMTSTRDSTILGKRLDAIAKARGVSPVEAAIQIILNGGSSVASFNMNDKDIEKFMVQDFIVTDSDGSDGHPRKYGTFPKIFREYVRNKKTLTLRQAVERSSSHTAKMFGFKDRGVLAEGAFADVIVFDAANFVDRSTYEQPTLLAEGMKYVLVNGSLAIDGGKFTGAMAGRIVRR